MTAAASGSQSAKNGSNEALGNVMVMGERVGDPLASKYEPTMRVLNKVLRASSLLPKHSCKLTLVALVSAHFCLIASSLARWLVLFSALYFDYSFAAYKVTIFSLKVNIREVREGEFRAIGE